MGDFVDCAACGLKHRRHDDGICPRCRGGAVAPSTPTGLGGHASPVTDEPSPRVQLRVGAMLLGVAADLVSSVVGAALLGAVLHVPAQSATIWLFSAGCGVAGGWLVARRVPGHEVPNAMCASGITLMLVFVLVGIPQDTGGFVDAAVIPPLYALGAGIAMVQRRRPRT